jgi:hypothetical protein
MTAPSSIALSASPLIEVFYTNSLNQNDGLVEEGGGGLRSPQEGFAPLPPFVDQIFGIDIIGVNSCHAGSSHQLS